MVTENNSQTNTFIKGMNSDTSYSMLQEGQYVYANNVRIFQIDNQDQNGQGEVRAIEGIKEAIEEQKLNVQKILASGSIRDLGVVILKHNNETWSVHTFKNTIGSGEHTDSKFNTISELEEIFHSIEKTKRDSFDIVCRHEDDDNIKLYIADGENPIMLLNLSKKYEGFTSINSISSHPTVELFPAKIVGIISGKLKAGMVSYAYRLYSKYGQASEISPATRMYPVINKYRNQYEGLDVNKDSTIGFRISIDLENIKEEIKELDHVEIYRIHYSETGQLPTISLISNIKIKEDKDVLYINDIGNSSLKNITLEEFNTLSGSHIIPEIIESKNDYMFAAKIKNDNYAYINEEIKNWDSRSYSYNRYGICTIYDYDKIPNTYIRWNKTQADSKYSTIPNDFDCFDINNIMTNVYEDRFDINGKRGGTGKNISWNFIFKDVILDCDIDGDSGRIVRDNMSLEGFDNPIVASESKSLRRGELYRYGIILYSKYGSKSDVKWIADIRVPDVNTEGFYPFKIIDGSIYGRSIGIEFNVNTESFPEGVIGYEIVRCNRTTDDIKNITQGVLSKPVMFLDNTTLIEVNGQYTKGDQSKIYPYMPTGYLTTAYWAGGDTNLYRRESGDDCSISPFRRIIQYGNFTEYLIRYYDNFENRGVYQFVSPETTYLKDYISQVVKENVKLNPCRYLFPSVRHTIGDKIKFRTNSYTGLTSDPYNIFSIHIGRNAQLPIYYAYEYRQSDYGYVTPYLYVNSKNKSLYTNMYWTGKDSPKFSITTVDGGEVSYNNVEGEDWKNLVPISYSYCKLYENSKQVKTCKYNEIRDQLTIGNLDLQEYCSQDIKDIKQSTEGSWNSIYESDKDGKLIVKYDNYNITVGDSTYCNYVLGTLYGVDGESADFPIKSENTSIVNGSADDTLVATGGRCFVFQLKGSSDKLADVVGVDSTNSNTFDYFTFDEKDGSCKIIDRSIFGTFLCNIYHDIIPYNGGSYSSIVTTSYYSYGDFFDSKTNKAKVFDGDCYPTLLEYVSAHKVYGGEGIDKKYCTTSIIYAIPVESNINTFLTNGFEFSRNIYNSEITNLQIEPSQVSSYLTQDKELYRYNSVYSSYSTHNPYISESDDVKYNANNDCRVYFSEMKSNNENIDSWTTFKASNYIDVDSRYGAITALKDFKNILFFWQENATGRLASKERSVVQDVNNIQLALGTGDILERYDYIDYIHGLHKDQFCLTQSNEALYWFDEHNQAIRATVDGQSVQDLTVSAGVSNYMNKYEQEDKNPKLFFDQKYNELISSVLKDRSIIYNQNLKAFTSFTDITFDDSITFNNGTYLLKKDNDGKLHIAQWNCKQEQPKGWNDTLHMALTYVINKQSGITKVFDNQEIITTNKPYSDVKTDKQLFECLNYSWYTDINKSKSTLEEQITDREGNFRYAIPRANNAKYGDRIRGKYMICEIEGESNYDISISYILTKFRTSFS